MNKSQLSKAVLGVLSTISISSVTNAADVSFKKQISPIFQTSCYKCHNSKSKKPKAGLKLDNYKSIMASDFVREGDSKRSPLYYAVTMKPGSWGIMPPKTKGKPLTKAETDLIKQWIDQGAKNN